MNMAVGKGVIAAGQDGTCCVMKYKRKKQEEETKATGKDTLQVFASKYFVILLLFLFYCFVLFVFLQGTRSKKLMSGNVLEKSKRVKRLKVAGPT